MRTRFGIFFGAWLAVACGRGTTPAHSEQSVVAAEPPQRARATAGGEYAPTTPAGPGTVSGWHRVGHRPIQVPAISDGASRPHAYFSVVAFDSGEIVPINSWYHPQLFQYVPATSALVSRAVMFPHDGMGNEDDVRWRIRAHKGRTAAESLVFWHVMGWEEITDENGTAARDAAVFSTRPIQQAPGVMPRAVARVVNVGADANDVGVGPYRGGIDYDPRNRILFVSTDRTDRSVGHSIFQAMAVDVATGRFEGRAIASAPGPRFRHQQGFIRADPAHGLVLTESEDAWEREHPILYLTTYEPKPGTDVATFGRVQQLEATALTRSAVHSMPIEARDAVLTEQDGRVWAVVAGRGLWVFDLGPAGGPYTLGAPVGRIAIPFRAEALEKIGDQLVVSCHGLAVYGLSSVLSVRGEQQRPASVYRLPYATYELDVATIGGRPTLFLASGPEGLDVFEPDARAGSNTAGALAREPPRPVRLRGARAEILLSTGHGLRTMSAPVANADGDLAFWAVTEAGHEAIVLVKADGTTGIVAETGRGAYRALGTPSLASRGRVAFWAAAPDGAQSIVEWNGAAHELARTGAGTTSLDQPEIADTGAVLFARRDADDAGTLVVRADGGALSTVFADDRQWALPADEIAPRAQYDVSPTGEVVFVKARRDDHRLALSYWNGVQSVDVPSDDREVNFPRMVASGIATCRSWGNEVIKLTLVRTRPEGGPSQPEPIADRHTRYGGIMFGDFQTAAALSADDVVFAAQKFAPPTLQPDELGSALHRYTGAASLPGTLVATADRVEGATVRNVLFADAASPGHGAAFVLELERGTGVTYALARIPRF